MKTSGGKFGKICLTIQKYVLTKNTTNIFFIGSKLFFETSKIVEIFGKTMKKQ